jgi:hypothetical protein
MLLVGSFPFNSFLSSLFCHLGLFALAGKLYSMQPSAKHIQLSLCIDSVSLRLQISSSEFAGIAPEKAFGDFAFSAIVFLFIVFSFLG